MASLFLVGVLLTLPLLLALALEIAARFLPFFVAGFLLLLLFLLVLLLLLLLLLPLWLLPLSLSVLVLVRPPVLPSFVATSSSPLLSIGGGTSSVARAGGGGGRKIVSQPIGVWASARRFVLA